MNFISSHCNYPSQTQIPDIGSKQKNQLLTEAHLLNPVFEKVLLLLLESHWKRLTMKQLDFHLHFKAN